MKPGSQSVEAPLYNLQALKDMLLLDQGMDMDMCWAP